MIAKINTSLIIILLELQRSLDAIWSRFLIFYSQKLRLREEEQLIRDQAGYCGIILWIKLTQVEWQIMLLASN